MNIVEIFDPALCCPTGVCGPSVDPELTRMASAVFLLEKKGHDITRYNLATDPAKFAENEAVNKVLHEKGPDALPMTVLNGEVVKTGAYPSNEQLASWFGVAEEDLKEKKASKTLNLL
ncbi:arsenite efflux transporter metallochaperone ArsD [Mesobacillus maritimus]|uniref:arsenite efflux transporter metallochaperone ArsD n=1 Tax=Mesobacillus maritimus TaxID=1643336 RepID=UPI00203FA85A|nr:arsenite efflux transporter metallochaperone ArsD [Mesobacillus maritimus]MCM3587413.1 arsenite efflux transporter metallochaperone ArsD [Mesobacillus maritimus]MCM3667973.1 arsenite efflux transporter metallochaperone ArsD [Mesobacillus maritimus]